MEQDVSEQGERRVSAIWDRFHGALLTLAILSWGVLSFSGCGSEDNTTIQGLQEENRGLKEDVSSLKAELKEKREQHKQSVEQLKRDSAEKVTELKELNRQKLRAVEGKLASVRLELGAVQREKLALEDLAESGPRKQMAQNSRFMTERLAYLVLLGTGLFIAGVFCFKWKRTNDRLQQVVLQEVSDLRRIGGTQ